MPFNSFDFAVFFVVFFGLYWFVTAKNLRLQNLLILLSSYLFYGWWDYRFLALIFISSVVDYTVGRLIYKEKKVSKRRLLLLSSLVINIGFLLYFKYFNFFIDSFRSAFTFFGYDMTLNNLEIILPVGISFYTFQSLSYTIDIYRKKFKPEKNLLTFLAFVSFFPQLVAGPIERAAALLPQFNKVRKFDYKRAVDGSYQILWGLFKKIVIADGCAQYVNIIFENHADLSAPYLILGAVLFGIQIYGDFSGYSDIAIGVAKILGFNLMTNFAYPYFSRDIMEFWRRWHISLTSWFKDYIYIPLGGNRGTLNHNVRNIFIVFLISGIWHGANWTFVVWGLLNAVLFVPIIVIKSQRMKKNIGEKSDNVPSLSCLPQILLTFTMVSLIWVFFRAESLTDAFLYLGRIFNWERGVGLESIPWSMLALVVFMFVLEWIGRTREHPLNFQLIKSRLLRWPSYYAFISLLYIFAVDSQEFIYFQF